MGGGVGAAAALNPRDWFWLEQRVSVDTVACLSAVPVQGQVCAFHTREASPPPVSRRLSAAAPLLGFCWLEHRGARPLVQVPGGCREDAVGSTMLTPQQSPLLPSPGSGPGDLRTHRLPRAPWKQADTEGVGYSPGAGIHEACRV